MRTLAILLLLFCPILAEVERVRVYEPYLPGTEPRDAEGAKEVVAVRLLRREGHRVVPVVSGRVTCWTEEDFGARLVAEGWTDAYGIANLTPGREGGRHWHFEAEGCAAHHDFADFPAMERREVLLEPGREVTVEFKAPFGGPLVGARVENYLGCPHSPALRTVTTDAAGLATFRDIGGYLRLWITAPGVEAGPYNVGDLTVGTGGVRRVLTRPGVSVGGRVVGEDGVPIDGIHVVGHDWPRGPKTVTDEAGRFTLHGLLGSSIGFYPADRPFGGLPAVLVSTHDPEVPLLVCLPEDRPMSHADGEARHGIDVVVQKLWPNTRGGTTPLGENGVPVTLVRLSDGFRLSGRSGEDRVHGEPASGFVRFSVPSGEYRVVAGGEWSEFDPVVSRTVVPRAGGRPLRVELGSERVGLRIRTEADLDGLSLRIPGLPERGDADVKVPASGPVALAVDNRVLLAGPVENEVRSIIVPEVKPTRVRFRLEPMQEDPSIVLFTAQTGWLTSDFERVGDHWEIRTRAAGSARIEVTAEGFREGVFRFELPIDAGRTVDLGTLELERSSPWRVRFTTPEGETPQAVRLTNRDGEECGTSFDFSEPTRSYTVHVESEGSHAWVSRDISIEKDRPRVLRALAGRITATVTGADGPIPVRVYLDGETFDFPEGRIDIRGVAAGPHVLIVGSSRYRGQVSRINLEKGEHSDFPISLGRRE